MKIRNICWVIAVALSLSGAACAKKQASTTSKDETGTTMSAEKSAISEPMSAMSAPKGSMEVGETPDGVTAPPKDSKGMNPRKQLEGLDD